MPFLFAFREDRFGFRFEIGDRAVIGRSPESDLIVFDPAVSRLHTEILRNDNGYVLKDLDSSNGTFFNGSQVDGQVDLKRNDEIKLGEEIFLFDPALDVAVGKDGVSLIVGDVEEEQEGAVILPKEGQLGGLDRPTMAALLKVATALAKFSSIALVVKQTLYVLQKLLEADRIAILWPEGVSGERLTCLSIRPVDGHIIIPKPVVQKVVEDESAVLWPVVLSELMFEGGERTLTSIEKNSLTVPLAKKGEPTGLIYIESSKRVYTEKDLGFLSALASLASPAIFNTLLIGDLKRKASKEDEAFKGRVRLIGEHQQMKALRAMAAQAAQTDDRILLEGEEGTGKEILAQLIHSLSSRKRYPFISLNCASVTGIDIDKELFGQEAGELAEDDLPGLLEEAEGGTVFIDNIEFLNPTDQTKLLQAVEERISYRVGSFRPRPVNFRLIASTTADLKQLVDNETFREDLHQRISEFALVTSPLRELGEDVILLARYFLGEEARATGVEVPQLDPATAECFRAYGWPGNSGELKNVIERMMMFHQGDRVLIEDLPIELRLASEAFKEGIGENPSESIREVEKDLIRKALGRANGNRRLAADLLGMNHDELDARIRSYDIFLEQTVVMDIT